jgi:CubicO group peptidase (beta-lactamase class C family)
MTKQLGPYIFLLSFIVLVACKKNSEPQLNPATQAIYFPPLGGNVWLTTPASSLAWNESELNNLYPYLQSKDTKAFIILKNGKIVVEKYFGSFTVDSLWYWASAGKTITGLLTGIAQQEGFININNRTSQYLGTGWTSAPLLKENMITVKHQLTMTTGLDDSVTDEDCTSASCLLYKADAGTRWAYHNAAYTLLGKVVENATGISYNKYFQEKIRDKIGMNGLWIQSPNANNVFYSNARSMARFGLLMLNKGKWDNTSVMNDTSYFNSQVSTSQSLNLSYGYLTWLNGKSSFMVPTSQLVIPGSLISNGPPDLYAALGKNDQKIYVVPSQQLVVIRMGNAAGGFQPAVSGFDNELWSRLKKIMNY